MKAILINIKQTIFAYIQIALSSACNYVEKTYEKRLDSAINKLDSLGTKIGDAINKTAESAGVKLGRLKDSSIAKGGRLNNGFKVAAWRMKDTLKSGKRDTTRY